MNSRSLCRPQVAGAARAILCLTTPAHDLEDVPAGDVADVELAAGVFA
ncbi:MAG: hypothetical protein ABIU29_13125 [Chthoniobacterales bacterium]